MPREESCFVHHVCMCIGAFERASVLPVLGALPQHCVSCRSHAAANGAEVGHVRRVWHLVYV